MCWVCDAYGDPEFGDGKWYLNPKNHSRQMYKIKKPGQKDAAYGSDPEAQSGRTIREIMNLRFEDPVKFQQLIKEANDMREKGPFQIGQVIPIQEAFKAVEMS